MKELNHREGKEYSKGNNYGTKIQIQVTLLQSHVLNHNAMLITINIIIVKVTTYWGHHNYLSPWLLKYLLAQKMCCAPIIAILRAVYSKVTKSEPTYLEFIFNEGDR
jgi:hypothetical protein